MTTKHPTIRRSFAAHLLSLPKELRELVYADVFSGSAPVPLENAELSSAGQALVALGGHPLDPGYEAEVLEAYYTYNTFSIRFSDDEDYACLKSLGYTRCSCATVRWLPEPQHCRRIRDLTIHTQESSLDPCRGQTMSMEDLEAMYSNRHSRLCWEQLLAMPRLEQLAIRLQKQNSDIFTWACFTPVLFLLRERLPRLQLSLTISFDDLLESYWSDPFWENATEPGNVVERLYDPMGFPDITQLIEAPTKEDIAYVEEHLPKEFSVPGHDILRGLLDEVGSQRRALAIHYVVKEPALLRVRIKEHYEVYKKTRAWELHQDVQISHS